MKLIPFVKGSPKLHRLVSVLTVLTFYILAGWLLLTTRLGSDDDDQIKPYSPHTDDADDENDSNGGRQLIVDSLRLITETPYSQIYSQFYADSIANYGSQLNLHAAFMKLFNPPQHRWLTSTTNERRQFRIAAIGGSTTIPHGIKVEGYFMSFCNWLRNPIEKLGFEVVCENWAIGATDSKYFTLCIDEFLELANFDMIFLEFALNDVRPSSGEEFEQLIRALRYRNPHLHIIVVLFPHVKRLLTGNQPDCTNSADLLPQLVQIKIAERFNVTALRSRHFFCNDKWNISLLTNEQRQNLAEIYVSKDGFHPSGFTHLMMTEFLVAYFRKSLQQLSEAIQKSAHYPRRLAHSAPSRTNDFDVECFVSYNWNGRQNNRLIDAIIPSRTNHQPPPKILRNALDLLNGVWLENVHSSVEFELKNFRRKPPRCRNGSYLPRLAIAHKLEYAASQGNISVDVKFVFSDRSVVTAKYYFNLTVLTYRPNYVEDLHPYYYSSNNSNNPVLAPAIKTVGFDSNSFKQRFCSSTASVLEQVYLRLEQQSKVIYPLDLNTIIVIYDCCADKQ